MNYTESLDGMIVIADELATTIVHDPVIDSTAGMSPEAKARQLALNERLRPKRPVTKDESTTPPESKRD